jgi:hypothetical protein
MHVALALTLALSVGQIRLQDEAVDQGSILQINCSGTGINCTRSGSTGTLTVAAGVTPGSACAAGSVLTWNGSAYSCTNTIANATASTTATSATTASALAANPTDCGANTFATTIDASGNLTCSAWTHLFWGDQHTDIYTADAVAQGAMVYYNGSAEPGSNKWRLLYKPASNDYVAMSPGTGAPRWEAVPNCHTSTRALNYDTSTDGWTCNTAIDASTAAALAANPTDCSAGQFATTIDASGNLTCSTPVGYSLQAGSLVAATTTDAQTIFFGCTQQAPSTSDGAQRCYIPKAGTVKAAYVYARAGTAGTGESWTCSFRLNRTTDTSIQALASTSADRVWSNTSLSVAVAQGDFFEVKCVNPTWATNPANVLFSASVYIE